MRIIVASVFLLSGAALVVAYALTASAGAPASVRTVPATINAAYDDGPFEVQLQLSNLDHQGEVGYDDDRDTVPDRFAPSIGLGAFEATFTFNSGVLEIVGVEPGDVFDGSPREPECFERESAPGQYAVGCVTFGPEAGPQGSGVLATFTFRPIANGTTPLTLEAQLGGPLGDEIAATVAGGAVHVSGAPRQAPTPTPTSDAPPATPGPGNPTPAGPTLIGDGTPGVPSTPVGGPSAGPSAGTGYEPPDATLRPLIIGGSLAALGFVLLAAGSRLALRRRD